jgi:hypothetical protein
MRHTPFKPAWRVGFAEKHAKDLVQTRRRGRSYLRRRAHERKTKGEADGATEPGWQAMSPCYAYEITFQTGERASGTLTHLAERTPRQWSIDDIKGLFLRLRDLAAGESPLNAGEQIFTEFRTTPDVGTLIIVAVRGATASLQLPDHLNSEVVIAWHKQQPGFLYSDWSGGKGGA